MSAHRIFFAVLAGLASAVLSGCSEQLVAPMGSDAPTPLFSHTPYQTSEDPTTIELIGLTLTTRELTYQLMVNKGAPQALIDGATAAIAAWAHALQQETQFTLEAAEAGESAKFRIRLRRGGGLIAGMALLHREPGPFGQIEGCSVTISGSAFGFPGDVAQAKSIGLQEIGHCLGLDHADNSDDVMFGTLQDPPVTALSECDVSAFLVAHDKWPQPPTQSEVTCPPSA